MIEPATRPASIGYPSRRPMLVDLKGPGRMAGRAYGEACRPLVAEHLAVVLDRLARVRGRQPAAVFQRAEEYREATLRSYPSLAAEVDGLAEGADLPVPAAWVLQLRAELMQPDERSRQHECTSLAVIGEAHGGTLAGQNADLPAFYADLLVLVRRESNDAPRLLTLTPAGQIGYHGINEHGVAVFANFLHSGGWRVGVPRYLLTRIALSEATHSLALAAVEATYRASPRNILVADPAGATDLETTVTGSARLEPDRGLLAHTNHYLAPELRPAERAEPAFLENSRRRYARVTQALEQRRGRLDLAGVAEVLRSRDGAPDALSREVGEWDDSMSTVASTIADISARRLWITIGPPHLADYVSYDV